MGYEQAVETLTSRDALMTVLLFLAALLAVFLAVGQAIKLWRDLKKPKEDAGDSMQRHVQESEERFKRGEAHIAENHQDIRDLQEGLRVTCVANIALLNHAIHNGNTAEMEAAARDLNNYLINRK